MVKKDSDEGFSLDDAFDDDDDVEYAESKPRKIEKSSAPKNKKPKDKIDDDDERSVTIKGKKPISELGKGDKIKVDNLNLEVDSHYIMIDHGTTKEMAIELFDPKTDKDYQIRYFSDNVENSIEFYELEEIIYVKRDINEVSW